MSLNCPNPNPFPQSKNSVDLSKVSNIRKLIRESQAMRRKMRRQVANQAMQVSQDVRLREKEVFEEWLLSTEKAINLDPSMSVKLEDQLAAQFNYRANNALDSGLEFNTAGEIRANLVSAKRNAENMVDLATKYISTKKIREMGNVFKETFNKYNIPKERWDELRLQIHEIGQQWDDAPLLGRTKGQEWLMKYRQDKLVEELDGYGLPQAELKELIEVSRELSNTFDDIRTIANAMGVDVGSVQNIGYMRRALEERYGTFFEARYGKQGTEANRRFPGIGSTAVKRSRESWHFIPEDFKALQTLPAFKGMSDQDLMKLFTDDPLKFRQFLHDKVSQQELETLVQTGLMSKIPMTSVELNDYLNDVFPLPFKAINEKFKTDPLEALADYGAELKRAAGEAAMFKYVGSVGVRSNWAAPGDVVRANREVYKDWVPLDYASFERFGLKDLHDVMDTATKESLGKMYVHPRVERQLMSLARVSMRPEELGQLAQVFVWVNKHFNVAAMLGSGSEYVSRLLGGVAINSVAAGMNISTALPRIWEFIKIQKMGVEALEGTGRTYTLGGKEYSAAEVARQFLIRQGQDVIPLHGNTASKPNLASLNPVLLPRALRDIYEYSRMFGDPITGAKMTTAYAAKQFDKGIQSAFMPLATVANYMELAFKYATWMSMFKVKGLSVPGKLGFFKEFDTFDEASRHLDEYFVNYHAIGEVPSSLRSFIPFSGYVLQNPPQQWRDMLRRPYAYSHYLMALQRAGKGQCSANLQAAGFTEQELDSFPVVLGCDPTNQSTSVLFPANYDPRVDAFIFLNKGVKTTLRLFGQETGNPFTDLKTAKGEGNLLQDLMKEWAQLGNATSKIAVEMTTGRSLFNDAPIWEDDDFRGIKVNPVLRYIVSRYPVVSAIEQNRGVGRLFDPLFPQKRVEDERGNVIDPGRDGILGSVPLEPMTRSEKKKWLAENQQGYATRLASLAGMSVRTIDIDEGTQYTLAELNATRRDLDKKWSDGVTELAKQRIAGKDTKRQAKELEDLALTVDQLEMDIMRLQYYLRERKVPEKQVLNELRDLKLENGIRSLPLPLESERILNDMAMRRVQKMYQLQQEANK